MPPREQQKVKTNKQEDTADRVRRSIHKTYRKAWLSGAPTSVKFGALAYVVIRPSGNMQLEPEPSLCSRKTATYPFVWGVGNRRQ